MLSLAGSPLSAGSPLMSCRYNPDKLYFTAYRAINPSQEVVVLSNKINVIAAWILLNSYYCMMDTLDRIFCEILSLL